MNSKSTTSRYALRTFRFDQLWLPFSFLALFIIVGLIVREQAKYFDLTRIYLSVVMPLVAGILAAYALIDDPTLELKFSTPVSMSLQLLERMGVILLIQLVTAGLMELFAFFTHVDLTVFGSFWQLQLVWLVPCLATMTFASFMALLGASAMSGAITIGLIWIVQAILHGYFAQNRITKYFFLFMGGLNPDHADLVLNRTCLLGSSLAFAVAGLLLLRRQERYL